MIPYGRQTIDDTDIAAVVEALRSDWLTQGPMVERFERALAERCGARHAVVVANGTVALHLACLAAGLGPGDEGITSSLTFLASANCMLYCGATPVFADVRPDTWNLDTQKIEAAITGKTKVLIPVHFAGLPCDMHEIRSIARRHGLTVIEDACHALGAEYAGHPVGRADGTDMVCFSFHPVKHITTGEGGAILTQDDDVAARLRTLRHHGITKDPARMRRNDGPWYYEVHELGYNGRLTDIQCALGLSQLSRLDGFLKRRASIANAYRSALSDLPGVRLQEVPAGRSHAYHLFVVHIDPARKNRRQVFEQLRDAGIAPQIHYVLVHSQPFMDGRSRVSGTMVETDRYYAGCLSLPIYPTLSESDQHKVIDTLRQAVSNV
jgi:UDP-4-amino-4,6-dideoxy-N-acetyl-beta-L-altrosamine transaminase